MKKKERAVHFCHECGAQYEVHPCRDAKTRYCSMACGNKAKLAKKNALLAGIREARISVGKRACSRCGETKELSAFPAAGGAQCKGCVYRRRKEWRAGPGRRKHLEERQRYREGHREHTRESDAGWRARNQEKVALSAKRSRTRMRERGTAPEIAASRSYVARTLGLRVSEMPDELFEAKRVFLLVGRALKEKQ